VNSPDPHRIESLFQEALDLNTADRAEFLLRIGGEPETRRAVEELLEAWDRVERKSAWNVDALQNMAASYRGARLDRYQIQDRIGAGGMGVVYKALRKEGEFSKLVALKIVYSDHPSLLQRFHQERQILASLDHPYIARLLDVGSTDDGSPYLAMDYVDGQPLDRYVKANALSRHDILLLFRKIAGAVSYAHRNLIVHRDLKPANILVTDAGEPKLLDFGIAKLIDSDAARTATGAAAMTPEYASPEQISGGVVTAASDIYSLGVLLYELLSGSRPYRETNSPAELAEAITTVPPKPLAGVDEDLGKIVQMALRKEPDRRYSSVEQFSEDVRRYLEGYPVLARADTRGYRISRFVRRNRVPVAAAALVVIAVTAGIYSTVRQARIAQRHFNDVRKLANSYLFEVYDGLRDLQGATALRQLVVRRALEYLDNLSQEQGNDTGLSRELANAYLRVGRLQGAPGYPNLGDPKGALASFGKALVISRHVAAGMPADKDIALELAEIHRSMGDLLDFQRDTLAASNHFHAALEISEKLAQAHSQDLKVMDSLANGYTFLANVTGNSEYPNLGNAAEAGRLYQKAREIREKLAQAYPGDRFNRLQLGAILEKSAAVHRAQAQDPLAIEALTRAVEIDDSLIRDEPLNALYRREAAVDNRSLCLAYLATKDFKAARETGDRSAALFDQLAKADPANIQAQEEVADSTWSQGLIREKEDDFNGAFQRYEDAIARYRQLIASHPGYIPNGMRSAYQLVAGLSAKLGDPVRTYRNAQKELEIDDQMLMTSPANAGAKLNRGVALLQIAQAHQVRAGKTRSAEEWRAALDWGSRSMEVWVRVKQEGALNPGYAAYLPRTQALIDDAHHALSSK
jgi:tetratricopeptide (TPR) repeat protein